MKTALLNGDLEEEIYIKPPEGLNIEVHKVCRLIKSLCGLRQAPRAWHIKLKQELAGVNFTASKADCILHLSCCRECRPHKQSCI